MTAICQKAKEEIQKAVENYPKHWDAGRNPQLCAFGIIKKASGDWLHSPTRGSACHAALYCVNREPSVVVNAHDPDYQGKYPEFVKWVCREAPFSEAIINGYNDDEILNHASVIDGEMVGQGGCLWLCKALRYPVEDTFRLPFWYQLREQGLDGLQAFIGCSIINKTGAPQTYTTHNSLFSYGNPKSIRDNYNKIRKLKKIDNSAAALQGVNDGTPHWGSLGFKTEKKSDGWGGFTEVKVPCDAKEFADKLKEIFMGDPKNVK